MIIEKEEIYTFKLISGEEIIAKVKEISSVDFVLDKPVMVLFDSQTGIQLLPVAFTADLDKTVRLNTRAVAMIFVTIESIKRRYVEMVNEPTDNKQIILG